MKINIQPSNNIFQELINQSMDLESAVAELCDNSLSSRMMGIINVDIGIKGNWNGSNNGSLIKEESLFYIRDDGDGIDNIEKFISPGASANIKSTSLNRHGFGAKNALAALGAKPIYGEDNKILYLGGFRIFSKRKEQERAIYFDRLCFGDVPVEELSVEETNIKFPNGSGTIIEIDEPNIYKRTQDFDRWRFRLGARYQNYTREDGFLNKRLSIKLKLLNPDGSIKQNDSGSCEYFVTAITPQYTGNGCAIINDQPLNDGKGKGNGASVWAAKFSFGLGLTEDDLKKVEDKTIIKSHEVGYPYHAGISKIDFFMNGVLICQKDLRWAWSDAAAERYFRNGCPRIQIHLGTGFDSVLCKNDIVSDVNCSADSIEELKNKLRKHPVITQYIKQNTSKAQEKQVQKKLQEQWSNDFEAFTSNAKIGPWGHETDFTFNIKGVPTITELKVDDVELSDLDQLITYLRLEPKFKVGRLIAHNICENKNINNYVKFINENADQFGFSIVLEDIHKYI